MHAIIVNDIDNTDVPGAIELRELDGIVAGIAFRCPCGCSHQAWLPVDRQDHPHSWIWDGNRDAPTLTPSILQSGLPCKWHGFLTAGEWRQC